MTDFPLCKKLGLHYWTRPLPGPNLILDFPVIEASMVERILEKAPVVYKCIGHKYLWSFEHSLLDNDTHTARLIMVEELAPKKCEHVGDGYRIDMRGFIESKCSKCGKKLKVNWVEAE